jgi:hypothetical protein
MRSNRVSLPRTFTDVHIEQISDIYIARQKCPPLPLTREDVIPDDLVEYLESLEG